MSKFRAFCFTLNNYKPDDEDYLSKLECKYIVYGHEVAPTTGTPHLQGYVSFKSPISELSARKKLPGCHVLVAKGSPAENFTYTTKEGRDIVERGVRPMSQEEKGDANSDRWKRAREQAMSGDLSSIDDELFIKYQRTFERIRDQSKPKPVTLSPETRHVWLYGPPGTGKSRLAREMAPNAYIKEPESKWWDQYEGQEDVIIDDFDKFQVKQGGSMKRWMDIYPFQAEIKGSITLIRPKRIIVTSNYKPDQIWDDAITVEAICRRIELIPIGPNDVELFVSHFHKV